MSKNNVNPDHYKVAGRERQGEDVVAVEHKQRFGNVQHDLAFRAEQRNQSLETMRTKQQQRKAAAASAAKKTTRKAAAQPEATATAVGARTRDRRAAPATKRASSPLAKTVARKAARTAKKTKRAAARVGATVSAAARAVASKAKNAVKRRPKQALPKRKK